MLSAPTTRPAMIADTLADVFAPAVPGTVTCSSTKSYKPACSANRITAGNPPYAIRFGSSKTGSKLWQTRTTSAPVQGQNGVFANTILPCRRSIRHQTRPTGPADRG